MYALNSLFVLFIINFSPAARTKATDEKFVKLREVYQKLRGEHIQLLRDSGETHKQLQQIEKEQQAAEEQRKVSDIYDSHYCITIADRLPNFTTPITEI